MKVKQLIADNPQWLEYLQSELKIDVVRDGDLASLKYNQIESPMHDPIVQECRGMVVHVPTGKILAHPYNKFWNYGEALAAVIDWDTARVLEKLDGSLMILYWDPSAEKWAAASSGTPRGSGTFGNNEGETFGAAFWRTFDALRMELREGHRGTTFTFEFCDQPNRIVVRHERARIVLHGARDLSTGQEWGPDEPAKAADNCNWELVRSFPISSIADCLAAAEALNPIECEGFVVVDANHNRVKIKSPRYVILHHMKGAATPRRAIELWQTGETAELLAHFPEMTAQIMPIHELLDGFAAKVIDDMIAHASAPTRKDFALAIKDRPWSAACFRLYTGDAGSMLSVAKAKEVLRAQSLASLERLLESVGVRVVES
jgi:hypothetical protein